MPRRTRVAVLGPAVAEPHDPSGGPEIPGVVAAGHDEPASLSHGISLVPLAGDYESATFTLAEAVRHGLANNPRLRVLAARTAAARAGEAVAFAPFLPNVGFGYRFSGYTVPVLPASSFVPATFADGSTGISLAEMGLQWTLYDFGRTAGRYGQAVSQTAIASLQFDRARQTVAYEVASHALGLLAARALERVRADDQRDAEKILEDARNRRLGGVVDREGVLRAEVEVAARREDLVVARQLALDAQTTLNLAMGRAAAAPIEIADVAAEPPMDATLTASLERAIAERLELRVAQQVVASAADGERAARGEFLPRLFVRGVVARIDSVSDLEGNLAAAGIHFHQSIYTGGQRAGELRRSRASIDEAIAGSQVILDQVSAEVNLAFRGIASARERIQLGRTAVEQAKETLRLTLVKYENGDAIPSEIVDAQTALAQAQTRLVTARYEYLTSLSRLEYAVGGDQERLLERIESARPTLVDLSR